MSAVLNEWRLRVLIFSALAAACGYLAFAVWGGWTEVVVAFYKIGIWGTVVVLAMSLLNYGLRFVRWQVYLAQLGKTVPWRPSLRIYLSGFALTTTPGKAGEMIRGVLLRQRGVPLSATFAAFVSERLSDLIAIVLLTFLGLAEYPSVRGLVFAGMAGIGLLLLCLSSRRVLTAMNARAIARGGRLAGALIHLTDMLLSARRCHRPRILLLSTSVSLMAWGAEAVAFYWVLMWLGADVSLSFAIFVYAISMLAGALSFVPGGLGGAEAVMASLLVFKGMAISEAVAATVFIRLATLWFAVMIGLVALYSSRHGEEAVVP